MSSYYSNDSDTYNRFEQPFGLSYVSTQSTSATELSSFDGNFVYDQHSNPTVNSDTLLENLGLGAAIFDPGSTLNDNHGANFVGQTRPRNAASAETRSVYEEPWNPIGIMAPYFTHPGTSTQRSRDLAYTPRAHPNPITTARRDSGCGPAQQHHVPTLDTSRNERVAIPPMEPSNETAQAATRYRCTEPNCHISCSRAADVKRHFQTVHANGPYWLCDVQDCGYWAHQNLPDKMYKHCRDEHRQEDGGYRYHLVDDVGPQNYTPKVSLDGKQTRRRKKRVAREVSA